MCVGKNQKVFPFIYGGAERALKMLRSEGFHNDEARLGATKREPDCVVTEGRATEFMLSQGFSPTRGKLIERKAEAGGGFD